MTVFVRSLAGLAAVAACGLAPLAMGAPAAAAPSAGFTRSEERAPCADYDALRAVRWGDLHVHTRYSLDASTQDTRNTPADAYRFARGERLGIQPYDDAGRALRSVVLERPLDFAAVTDHAELFGEVAICQTPGLPGHDSLPCRIYRGWPRLAFFLMNSRASMGRRYAFCGPDGRDCLDAARGPWRAMQQAAEQAYDRSAACTFTSFVGYEWTGSGGMDASNLHRNVIFRNAVVPELPTSFVDGTDPAFLWHELDRLCRDRGEGCDAIVIPHNSNLSAEKMWPLAGADGRPLGREQAALRARSEPLVEIIQHKGGSECRLGAGTSDEDCSFELLPYDTMRGVQREADRRVPGPRNFVRTIVGEGLVEHERLGVNPFKLGFIGSTDTHLGTPGYVNERRHVGHGGAGPPVTEIPTGLPDRIEFNPGGLAGVWSEENSRDSVFAALARRETFATSGPRISVRFFGGGNYPQDLCERGDLAARGYAGGVPMGGDLTPSPSSAPTFVLSALRDPGTPARPRVGLQRAQIVKLWVEDGRVREAVHPVAGTADDGADVDLATCMPHSTGPDALCSVWRDPDFDASQSALYYARVLEDPTCRWSTWVCNANAIDCSEPDAVPEELAGCCDPAYPRTIQERAWTSPIWYTPEARSSAP